MFTRYKRCFHFSKSLFVCVVCVVNTTKDVSNETWTVLSLNTGGTSSRKESRALESTVLRGLE